MFRTRFAPPRLVSYSLILLQCRETPEPLQGHSSAVSVLFIPLVWRELRISIRHSMRYLESRKKTRRGGL